MELLNFAYAVVGGASVLVGQWIHEQIKNPYRWQCPKCTGPKEFKVASNDETFVQLVKFNHNRENHKE